MSINYKKPYSDDLFGSASFGGGGGGGRGRGGGQGRKGRPKNFDNNRPKGNDYVEVAKNNGCAVGTAGGAVGGAIAGAAGARRALHLEP